jgi:integrase
MTRIKDRYGWIAKGRLASMEVRQRHADANATELAPIIAEIRAAGVTTPYGIAKALNALGVPTVKGKSKWRVLGVRRVLARLKTQDSPAPATPLELVDYRDRLRPGIGRSTMRSKPGGCGEAGREAAAGSGHHGRRLRVSAVDAVPSGEMLLATARASGGAQAAEAMTFKQCAEKMHAHRTHWGRNYTAQWFITLSIHAFPVIGNLPVATINTGLVLNVLEPIWASKTETASRLRGRIEKVLNWAKARGYRYGKNPARWRGHLEHFLPAPAVTRKFGPDAALAFDELPRFMTMLRAQKGIAARALEFLILTMARRDEVIGARWGEIDRGAKIWIVRADRMKGGQEHLVPLSARVIEILEEMKTDGNFVFGAGQRQLGAAMTRLLRRLCDGPTEQELRVTFREWATERAGFPREIAEIALAVVDHVEAAYTRDVIIAKQRELMDAWTAACSGRALQSSSPQGPLP